MKKDFPEIGIQIPEILLPKSSLDLQKWAVIACDQFTSEPEYWRQVEEIVGKSPSTLNLILPEVYLGKQNEDDHLKKILSSMQQYHENPIFDKVENFILVERNVAGKTRHGLIMALDLEKYDFRPGSDSLIRASEGTIIDRLPPRIKIRQQASIESTHILVLIDDPEKTVIEPLIKQKSALKTLYDFDLMQNSGHLKGFLVNDTNLENAVVHAISNLADCDLFKKKYNLTDDRKCLLFAVGDGNHSLATAKSVWEKLKPTVGMHHPARYALVEIENVHDAGLEFEPIHRVLFGVKQDIKQGLKAYFGDSVSFETISNRSDLQKRIAVLQSDCQSIGLISPAGYELVCIRNPRNNLAVGSLQNFLDQWLKSGGADNIDYVHGEEIVFKIGSQPGHIGFIVPGMPKADLFRSVIFDGSLPRKAFSMGEAREKRFYMECRYLS